MPALILTDVCASIAELKRNPPGTVAAADGAPVVIIDRNRPAFYCVPAGAYEALMAQLDDWELSAAGKRERNAVYQAAVKR